MGTRESIQSVMPCSGPKCQRYDAAEDEINYIKVSCIGDKLHVENFKDMGCNIAQEGDEGGVTLAMGECVGDEEYPDDPKLSYRWPDWVCGGGKEKVKCQKIKKDNKACEARRDCMVFKGKKCRPLKSTESRRKLNAKDWKIWEFAACSQRRRSSRNAPTRRSRNRL